MHCPVLLCHYNFFIIISVSHTDKLKSSNFIHTDLTAEICDLEDKIIFQKIDYYSEGDDKNIGSFELDYRDF